jgi:hypothetical protein
MSLFHIKKNAICATLTLLAAAVLLVLGFDQAHAAALKQKTFASAEEAAGALLDAVKTDDGKALLAIFGPGGRKLIFSGDEVADREGRLRFVSLYTENHRLESPGEGRAVLYIGKDDYPFPIPIVKQGPAWRFDTQQGRREILARRIGKNELSAVQVCLAFVDAQREYARKDRDNNGLLEYARRFVSTPGRKDGLYWESGEGEEQSPMGPLFAGAEKEGYPTKVSEPRPVPYHAPYHGYFYRILKAQGPHAPGGEYDYLVKGKLIGGFALIAYPAKYGASGIMTFLVNQDGVVYQKNLGRETEKAAQGMRKFDPDETWKKVE